MASVVMYEISMNSLKDVKVIKVKPLFKFWFEIARKAILHVQKHMSCPPCFPCADFSTSFLNSITKENAKHVGAFGSLTSDKEKSELVYNWIRKYHKQFSSWWTKIARQSWDLMLNNLCTFRK